MNANETERKPLGQYRPKLCFYHANLKGTGSAVSMNLHPAHDDTDGCVMLTIANQLAVGNRMGPNTTCSTFDWGNAMTVKLDFGDLTQMLQVFRGECESVNGEKGLYHLSPVGATSIRLRHLVDPVAGYSFEVYRHSRTEGEDDKHAGILFSPAEALGVCEAIAGSLYLVAFGIPMLVPHDTSAYQAAAKELRNANANANAA